ncbi:glycosyltransferase [Sulfolobus acidocaldarius SUSAZ]|nr:glycosyltransferase [Sulfolobus acidocaldarius SUSAZ]
MLKQLIIKYFGIISALILAAIISIYTFYTVSTFAGIKDYVGDEVWYPSAAYNILKLVFHVQVPMNFPYPNEANIQYYVNPEHPPLPKYIMALFIYALGYNPLVWRIPSWILGDLIIIIAFLMARKLIGNSLLGNVTGLIASILIALDPNIWVMHGLAMLEIYAGFFSIFTLYLLLSNRIKSSSVGLGLAFLAKESLLPLLIPYIYYLGEIVKQRTKRVIYGILIPLVIYVAFSIPLIIYFGGIKQWLDTSFLHMLSWDVTNGHISLSATNQISTPWDWFFNIHPFFLGYGLYANVNPLLMWAWVVTTPLAFIMKDIKLIIFTMSAWSIWLGFVAVYFLGNHTLFSFYVTDFATISDVFIPISLFKFLNWIELRNKGENN